MLQEMDFRYSCIEVVSVDIDYTALGKRVAAIRRKRKLTQEQLAEQTELSNIYISHIENSRSIPSLETLMKLCGVLQVTPDELLLGTNPRLQNYLQEEIIQKLAYCTPKQRRIINGFIDLLLSEDREK